jgi:hypothetical protein
MHTSSASWRCSALMLIGSDASIDMSCNAAHAGL